MHNRPGKNVSNEKQKSSKRKKREKEKNYNVKMTFLCIKYIYKLT